MSTDKYEKAGKYPNLDLVYNEVSGPGGLKLTEFLADRMGVSPGAWLLDVGCNRGFQTCFLAREYGVKAIGLDPWDDRKRKDPMVEHLQRNAEKWGVEHSVLGLKAGVPHTGFASDSFDFVYSTTALEMLRTLEGEEGYALALKEILRLLKPGGVFGLGEPMHLGVPIPEDLLPFVSQEPFAWKDCFRDIGQTTEAIRAAGFQIKEAGYAPDAWNWWQEYAEHDPFCRETPDEDPRTLQVDGGRWVSFGYVIARKPATGA